MCGLMVVYLIIHYALFYISNAHADAVCVVIGNITPYIGLVGTIIGFRHAFGGLSTATLNANNIQNVLQPLLSGVEIAMITTLVGAVLAIWIYVNRTVFSYEKVA